MTQVKKDKILSKKLIDSEDKYSKNEKQTYKKIINIPEEIKNKLIDIDDSVEEHFDENIDNNKLTIFAVKTINKRQEKIMLVFE